MERYLEAEPAPEQDSWSISFEIDVEAQQGMVQIPAAIKNLSGVTVTLEISNPWNLRGTESIFRKEGRICLTPPVGGTPITIPARVSWANWVGDNRRQMLLGLELLEPRLETYKLLENHLAHSRNDLKGLWERYDQARRRGSSESLLDRRLSLAGTIMLLCGLALQFPEARSLRLLGWMLWMLSTAGLAGALLWNLWQKRVSQQAKF
jgi:hypothetical protein